uniref:Haloacid dehalogenase-like hydrolase domain-containing protein 2 n=2 Tax=Arion vulgaris TaxID=1028688 RepID=A0A0B7BQ79_9EUPU
MSHSIKTVLVDLSGTLHIDNDQTLGAVEALIRLRATKKIHIKFVTNTTKESKHFLMTRLHNIGFDINSEEVFSSLSAARKLLEDRKLRPFYIIDKNALEDFEGISQEDSNAVVIGLAPEEFNYENMNTAMRLLHNGSSLIAIHKARYYKRHDGLALGPGPFVTALEYATGCKAEVIGKPSESFFLSSIADIGCSPSECIMIGDDVKDDIAGAQAAGMRGILVQTGKYRDGDELKINPPPFKVVTNFSHAVDIIEQLL